MRMLAAYGGRCAISHLPEPRLLDAAHIVMDADEQLGQPIISNCSPLTKLHHAAFDARLIGIEPDYRIHVSDRPLEIHDGPFLELGLKGITGTLIELLRCAGADDNHRTGAAYYGERGLNTASQALLQLFTRPQVGQDSLPLGGRPLDILVKKNPATMAGFLRSLVSPVGASTYEPIWATHAIRIPRQRSSPQNEDHDAKSGRYTGILAVAEARYA
jgi:hypothetical protein